MSWSVGMFWTAFLQTWQLLRIYIYIYIYAVTYSYIVECYCAVSVYWFLSVIVATWISFTKKEIVIISSSLWPFHMWSVIIKYAKFNGCLDFYFSVRVVVLCFVMYGSIIKWVPKHVMSLLHVYLFLGFCHVMRHSSTIPLWWYYYVRQQKCLNELVSNASSLSLLKCNCGFHIILFYLVLSVVCCQVFLCTWECAPFWIQEAEWKQKCDIWHLARSNLSDKISSQQIITVAN
jgi:hypothetical protein